MSEDPTLVLRNFPMPPSSNHQYIPVWRMKRMIPSKELKDFKAAMKAWADVNYEAVKAAKLAMSGWRGIRLHAVFEFPKEKLLMKDGRPQKLDVTNRLKAFHDSLSDILGVDDKWIMAELSEKVVGESPRVHITLQNTAMRGV